MPINLGLQRRKLARSASRITSQIRRELRQSVLLCLRERSRRFDRRRRSVGGEERHELADRCVPAACRRPDRFGRLRLYLRNLGCQLVLDRLTELRQRTKQFERKRRVSHVIRIINVDVSGTGIENADA